MRAILKPIVSEMSERAKRFLVTSEHHEVVIVRRGQHKPRYGACSVCGTNTELLCLDEAVTRSGKSTRDLIELTDRGVIHAVETAAGHLLICESSLAKE